MALLEAESQFEKVILKQDGCQIEIIKLLNNSLLTLSNKSFSSSVAVTEKEYEKIKANLDIIREKISRKKTGKIEENGMKRPKTVNIKPTMSRKRRNIPQNNNEQSQTPLPMCDLSFLEIPPPPYNIIEGKW